MKAIRAVLFFVSVGSTFPLFCSDAFNFLLSDVDSGYQSENDDGGITASEQHGYQTGMNDDQEDRQPDDDVLVIPTVGFDPKR